MKLNSTRGKEIVRRYGTVFVAFLVFVEFLYCRDDQPRNGRTI